MHDILYGFGSMILKLVLHHYICISRKFTVNYFNSKIAIHFNMALWKTKSPNFSMYMLQKNDYLLSQKVMQMWILLRAFPFIVAEKIDKRNEHMELILLLLRIMEILLIPRTRSLMPYLRVLTKDLMDMFRKFFPHINVN